MKKNVFIIPSMVIALLGIGFVKTASAEDVKVGVSAEAQMNNGRGPALKAVLNGAAMVHDGKGIFGTVTAISGTTITVQSKAMMDDHDSTTSGQVTTYTVNAANAKIQKDNVASSISGIAVGDSIFVQGTISGTTVTATMINDGKVTARVGGLENNLLELKGNGQPVIGGKVTAVSGNTVTISNQSNVMYTIDVSNAKISKAGTTISASTIAVGDEVVAQGTVNGTSVTASLLIDGQGVNRGGQTLPTNASANAQVHASFFSKIGGFFKHLFGF